MAVCASLGWTAELMTLAAEQEPTSSRPVVEVAVGVLIDGAGAVLLGQRPEGKPYAGYWEFPGGKVEAGETLFAALSRELQEEIDVRIDQADEFMVLEHDYPHAYVRLHICFVKSWQGQPRGLENQALGWLNIKDIDQLGIAGFDPVLPATLPILEKLKSLKVF
ncbi:NUDIX domain-containing protein [Polynucleobacter sp. AM-26B4]|uniref:NUDIX domain-containing protein n=1 Tax=Polynucleobacter sp. AM-26B4 TaxID=2689103 RepID=UPI002103B3F6|nr:NUDIX domain-containing protein [Polynucleobacter sp. AM-26B4]